METAPIFIDDVLIVSRTELDNMQVQDQTGIYGTKKNCIIGTGKEQEELSYRIGLENVGNDIARVKLQTMHKSSETDFVVNASFSAGNIQVNYIDPLVFDKRTLIVKECRMDSRSCRFSTFTSLLDPSNDCLQDDQLLIRMKAVISIHDYFEKSSPLGSGLWTRDGDKDFTIVVQRDGEEEKTELKVHKLVIAVRSPVFDRMLQSDMVEKKEGKVIINDFGVDVVQLAIQYMYDQCTFDKKSVDTLIGLLQFADKYEMFDLKSKVENVLRRHIFPDTVAKISNASILFNAACLHNYCRKILNLYIASGTVFDGQDMDDDFDIVPV